MTDIRDPEPQLELKPAELETPRRQSLVLRALNPTRRPKTPSLRSERRPTLDVPLVEDFQIKPRRKFAAIILTIFVFIVLPTAAAGVYLFAFASDQYVSEARFAVRKAEVPSSSTSTSSEESSSPKMSTGSIMSGGFNLAGEDAEIVANYIHSRAIIDDISRSVDVRAIFRRPEADFWARLPKNASAEQLDAYWNRMVTVYIEASSGIVQVSARAFRRKDALTLAQAILKASEALANTMTLKIRADQMRLAEGEVHRSEGEVRFALADLTSFRNSQHLLDPKLSTESTGKLLLQLMSDKIETEGKLFVAQRIQGPNAPGLASVKSKLDSINQHITELQNQLAGDKNASKNMASTMARFEELELKKEFAEKMYGFARDGVERARVAAERQAIYLAVFEPPELAQDYSYPVRWTDFILIGVACLMLWICGATITASIMDHRL